MKTKITFFLLFLTVHLANAQTLAWAKAWGSPSTIFPEVGNAIAVDGVGNAFTIGSYSGIVDFDPGPGTFTLSSSGGSIDIFISKLDASGNFLWAKSLGGTGSGEEGFGITTDAAGNVYTTGYFQNTSDFDPGPGTYTLATVGFYDVFILKLDAAGNFVWAKNFGNSGLGNDYGYAIKTGSTGDVYITGIFNATVDFDPGAGIANLTSAGSDDIFISKFDAAGNFIWVKNLGGTGGDVPRALDVDATGNVYLAGNFSGTTDMDPGAGTFTFTSVAARDAFVCKLDPTGNFIWAKQFGGTGDQYAYSVHAVASGDVYTSGQFPNTVDFDPGVGTFTLASSGSNDAYISKLDASGNFVWAKKIGGSGNETGTSVSTDVAGNVYLGGSFGTTVDFDPGPGTVSKTSAGGSDIFVLELDAAGNFVATTVTGGTGGDGILAMVLHPSGSIYGTGNFTGTCDFDPVGTYTIASVGGQDAFVMKLNGLGTGIGQISEFSNAEISIYPNPSSGVFKLNFNEEVKGDKQLTMFDINGKEILKQTIQAGVKQTELEIKTPGLYFLNLETEEGKRLTRKVVVQ